MTEPVLDLNDRSGAVWKKIKDHLEARLAKLRERNDKAMPDEATRMLRGRIAEVKDLLSLGTDKPRIESEDTLFKD